MSKSKSYPTRLSDRQNDRNRPIEARRTTPDIWVRVTVSNRSWRDYEYRKAHLRNKAGYLYLSWRDAEGVHSHYLGKAPKACPTLDPAGGSSRSNQAGAIGRGKNNRRG